MFVQFLLVFLKVGVDIGFDLVDQVFVFDDFQIGECGCSVDWMVGICIIVIEIVIGEYQVFCDLVGDEYVVYGKIFGGEFFGDWYQVWFYVEIG